MTIDIGDKKKYLQRRISSKETFEDLLRFPRFLEIETIHACNAKCDMCTINDWERPSDTMSDEMFDKISSEIIDNAGEVKRVSLYKDGEPLLDLKLSNRIATLKDGGVKDVAISTNISVLTKNKAREILEAGLDIIIMSFDSIRKETYEAIRKGLEFEQVLENTLSFIESRNKIRPQTKIWMRMVLQEKNRDEWPEFNRFWLKRLSSSDRINYHTIHNWGGQLKNVNPLTDSYQPSLPCVALWSHLVIFANGDVPNCTLDYSNKYPIGNISKNSISELWSSKVLASRREKHITDKKAEITICEHCNAWDETSDLENISADYAEATKICS